MSSSAKTVLSCALTFAGIRAVAGVLLILASLQSGEAAMLVLFDLPTLGAYWVIGRVCCEWGVVDAYDLRFWCVSLVTWALLGGIVGIVIRLVQSRTVAMTARDASRS